MIDVVTLLRSCLRTFARSQCLMAAVQCKLENLCNNRAMLVPTTAKNPNRSGIQPSEEPLPKWKQDTCLPVPVAGAHLWWDLRGHGTGGRGIRRVRSSQR